jgi:hypothetical protein
VTWSPSHRDSLATATIDRANPITGTVLDALGLRRPSAGLERLAKIQGLGAAGTGAFETRVVDEDLVRGCRVA